jgi:hypothetical protein
MEAIDHASQREWRKNEGRPDRSFSSLMCKRRKEVPHFEEDSEGIVPKRKMPA